MTENPARDDEPRKASSAPGLEGEGGQYVEGDYGDAGVVGGVEEQPEEGDYPKGNYGDAGVVGGVEEQPEEADYPEGDYGDAGVVGTARGASTAREVEEDEDRNS